MKNKIGRMYFLQFQVAHRLITLWAVCSLMKNNSFCDKAFYSHEVKIDFLLSELIHLSHIFW